MTQDQPALQALITAAQRQPLSRVAFMRRALALGLSVPAIAGLLADLDGPVLADLDGPVAAAAASPVQITFSSWGSLDEQITITQVLKVFQARYPAIQVQPILTSWANYWPKYNADLAAKSTADVQFLTFVPTYAAAGALTEIRSLLAHHGHSVPTGYTPAELSLFQHNGQLYGFPRDNGTEVIYYNRALFRKAGLPYPTNDWTWDELRTLARRLTVRTGNRVKQYGFAFETGWWRLYMWQHGAELFDSLSHPTKVTFNSPSAIAAIQFMGDLITKDKVTPPASQIADSTYIGPLFASGQLAMAYGNHALVPTFAKAAGLDWFVAGMPHFRGYPTVNYAGGAGYCISRWTKNLDAAYQLWSFMTGPVASLLFAQGNDLVPDNPRALASRAWLSKPYNKVFTEQTKLGHADASFAQFAAVYTAVSAELDKVWTGEEPARVVLPRAAAKAATLIKS